jgi:hypothetical protein
LLTYCIVPLTRGMLSLRLVNSRVPVKSMPDPCSRGSADKQTACCATFDRYALGRCFVEAVVHSSLTASQTAAATSFVRAHLAAPAVEPAVRAGSDVCRRSTAQHSTAQHSTITVNHSTAQSLKENTCCLSACSSCNQPALCVAGCWTPPHSFRYVSSQEARHVSTPTPTRTYAASVGLCAPT